MAKNSTKNVSVINTKTEGIIIHKYCVGETRKGLPMFSETLDCSDVSLTNKQRSAIYKLGFHWNGKIYFRYNNLKDKCAKRDAVVEKRDGKTVVVVLGLTALGNIKLDSKANAISHWEKIKEHYSTPEGMARHTTAKSTPKAVEKADERLASLSKSQKSMYTQLSKMTPEDRAAFIALLG